MHGTDVQTKPRQLHTLAPLACTLTHPGPPPPPPSVPLEGILQLAVQLKSHLLASAPRLAEPAEAPPQPPAAKRPKATAGSVGAAGTGRAKKEAASGKRRKQPAAAEVRRKGVGRGG